MQLPVVVNSGRGPIRWGEKSLVRRFFEADAMEKNAGGLPRRAHEVPQPRRAHERVD